jgi:hypothetical protein
MGSSNACGAASPHGEPSLLRPTPVVRTHYEHARVAIDDYRFA